MEFDCVNKTITTQKLYTALRKMGIKYLKPNYKNTWSPERPTTGYCYVVAEVVYHYIAPNGSKPYVINFGNGYTHWFVKDNNEKIIDLTADQFDQPLDYSKAKPQNFMTHTISKRGRILAELLNLV
jgi:uncharacterized protein (DUF362 family)